MELADKHILLGISGGIACYKVAELCRLLTKAGAEVQVVMTEAATRFVTPLTFQALTGRPVLLDIWDEREANGMAHINHGRWADLVLLAPCSADLLARLAQGRGDDLLGLMCLARPAQRVPLLIAPAMNREMWIHPATQRNLAQVRSDGAWVLGVGQGDQACGESGDGRLLEPEQLYAEVVAAMMPKLLAGKRVWVNAGPTFEAIDPVRGITNLSSGKMGFAVARAAWELGAEVTLVAGPVGLPTPQGVRRIDVQSAQQMLQACLPAALWADVFIGTAAVADWRVAHAAAHKLKKDGSGRPPELEFVENPDILATLAACERARSGQLFCVGFAAESEDLARHAQAKRERKGVPLLAANIGPDTFGRDDNQLLLIDPTGQHPLPQASKRILGLQLMLAVAERLGRPLSTVLPPEPSAEVVA